MKIFELFKKNITIPFTDNKTIPVDIKTYESIFNYSMLNNLTSDNVNITGISEYKTSWVNLCLNVRAENVANCETYLYKKIGKKLKEIEQHPFFDLLETTNTYNYGWNQILYLITQNLDIYGNAYLIIVKDGYNMPVEFIPVPSSIVTPIYNSNASLITGYNILEKYYSKDDILHFKIPNIYNNLIGKPTIDGLNRIIRVDNFQQIYSEKFFKNSGRISIALETDEKINNDTIERLRNQLRDEYSGVDNAGKTIVLDKGLKLKDFAVSNKEMDYVESRKVIRNEILSRMRVPPVLVGINESANRATADTELIFFLKHTIKPFSKNIENILNMFIKQYFGKNLIVRLEHPNPLTDEERKDYELGLRYGAITLNEFRNAINYESINGLDIMTPVVTNNISNNNNQQTQAQNEVIQNQ